MEAKQTRHAFRTGEATRPAPASLAAVSGFATEPLPTAEPIAPVSPALPPAKLDRVLALCDWFCAGQASPWEHEMTQRARWRLA